LTSPRWRLPQGAPQAAERRGPCINSAERNEGMDLNKVTLIGNMVRDPESRVTTGGQSVTRFSVATNYAWQDAKTKAKKEAVDFHDVIAWGKLGDIVQEYVKKG